MDFAKEDKVPASDETQEDNSFERDEIKKDNSLKKDECKEDNSLQRDEAGKTDRLSRTSPGPLGRHVTCRAIPKVMPEGFWRSAASCWFEAEWERSESRGGNCL